MRNSLGHHVWPSFAALLSTLALASVVHAQMVTPGQFQVTESGAASHTIPIQVPPGIGGMEPKLSLNYSSQSGNGLLGMGWNLGGLGGVGRCPRTPAQDGVRGGVNYDNNDRYCLDGQRLIAVSGSEGGDGTEYRTERESFAKIVSYGSAGIGPAWFKVWTKAGQTMEYGKTTDSRIEAQGKTTVRVWALNKIEDTKGNYLTVSYNKDSTRGDYYPLAVKYTGTAAQSPVNSILFEYETRSDIFSGYQAGSKISTQMRLKKIKTYASSNALVRDYRITYKSSTATSRSLISSIAECNANSDCLTAFNFDWQGGIAGFSFDKRTSTGNAVPSNWSWRQLIDVTNDGIPDLVLWNDTSSGIYVIPGVGDGTFDVSQRKYTGGQTPFNWSWRQVIDVNGDGIPDLVLWSDTSAGIYVVPGVGDGTFDFNRRQYTGGQTPFNWSWRQVIDVNGDGIPDLVLWSDTSSGIYTILGDGKGGFDFNTRNYSGGQTPFNWQWRQVVDVNGDGIPDLVLWSDTSSGIYTILGDGKGGFDFNTRNYTGGQTPFNWPWWQVMDVNGDGIPDLVMWSDTSSGIYTILGDGKGGFDFNTRNYTGGQTPFNWSSRQLVDINGDGIPDLVLWSDTSSGIYTILGDGKGGFDFNTRSYTGGQTPFNWGTRDVVDVHGDGLPDLVLWSDISSGVYIIPMSGAVPDLLVSVTENKKVTRIGYQSIASKSPDPSLYTRDSGVNASRYPVFEGQSPLYVVSTLTVNDGANNYSTKYSYGGLKGNVLGRGLLGFRWMQTKQVETGLTSYTEYQQTWPYTGLPSLIKKVLTGGGNNGVLSQVSNSYACNDAASTTTTPCVVGTGKRYFVYANQSVESGWDYNGAVLPVITTKTEYDNWGNATKVDVSTSDGYAKKTVNTYSNDSSNWYLGRLLKSLVESTAP